MGQYTSYWLYQKYEIRGSQEPTPCYPEVYSVDGEGTMPLIVKEEEDTQCGVKYRWVDIPITQGFICDDCYSLQYRWVWSDDTICIEEEPQTIYRWTNMDASVDYYCEGTTKYYKQKKQVSHDSGLDWEDVIPYEYQKGDVAKEKSTDCGYVYKLVARYASGATNEVECNESSTLTTGETRSGGSLGTMTSAVIGNCVTDIGDYAFADCSGLTSVTIPNSVTSFGTRSFQNCSGLTSVNMPDSVTSIGEQAFVSCTGLTSVNIPDSVTSIGRQAFYICNSLTSVDIPDSVTSIGDGAFVACGLSAVTIGSGITSLTQTFMECRYLDNVVVPRTVKELNATFSDCSGMTNITISDGVETIGTNAFRGCFSLSSVTIPDSVTTIGYDAFAQLSNGGEFPFSRLLNVTIGSGVTTIGDGSFYQCTGFTSIDIPSGVTSIGEEAFAGCESLTAITVNATTPPTLGRYAFRNTNDCPIYVPCESFIAYKTATNWDYYDDRIRPIMPCDFLKLQESYSDGTTYELECNGNPELTREEVINNEMLVSAVIGNCVTTIGNNAFSGCSSLTSCTIGSGVTSIGNQAFLGCSNLTSVTIPSGVTSIGNNAFCRCNSLTSVTIPSGVTSINSSVFESCSSLTSVTIPSGVTSIGYGAFYGCSRLTSVTVNATTPPTLGNDVFYATNNCPIYVPASSVNVYKSASRWSTYASRIQPIS